MKILILLFLICLSSFIAQGADIRQEAKKDSDGLVTTIFYRGKNAILNDHKFEEGSFTHVYDFVYQGEIYAQYFVGHKFREKDVYNLRLQNIRDTLDQKVKGNIPIISDCIVPKLKKKLETLPSDFCWIDHDGDGHDDRAYFRRYNERNNYWSLLEAFSIGPDGTVTPVTRKVFMTWKKEYEAMANKKG